MTSNESVCPQCGHPRSCCANSTVHSSSTIKPMDDSVLVIRAGNDSGGYEFNQKREKGETIIDVVRKHQRRKGVR